MHHGQNRGSKKPKLSQKSKLNENRGMSKFCHNRKYRKKYATCIIGLGGMDAPCSVLSAISHVTKLCCLGLRLSDTLVIKTEFAASLNQHYLREFKLLINLDRRLI